MKFFCAFMIYYYICSILASIILWNRIHKEDNMKKFEDDVSALNADIKRDNLNFKFTRDEALVGLSFLCVFFSFIIIPGSLLKRIIGEKDA